MLARQGACLLTHAGLSEWVAKEVEDYVRKVFYHATNLEKLARLRADLRRQVLASSLLDAPRFAMNFEAAMWGMRRSFY